MSNYRDITAPADQTEGTRLQILHWLKAVGDPVTDQEPLLEIETDKVTVELAAPGPGVLREILKDAGAEVAPGELLGRIEVAAPAAMEAPPTASDPQPPAVSAAMPGVADDRPGADDDRSGAENLSPSVRRLLQEHGLEPGAIRGTGAQGRLTARDVIAHAAARSAPARPATAIPATANPAAAVTRVPHSLLRKTIAARMVESLLYTAPHVTTVFEADLTAVLAHRARHRAEFERAGAPLTLTAYFIAACVAAIRAVPETNARWTDEALELHSAIDVGVATAIDGRGLIVPVIRDVAALDLMGVAQKLADLTGRARTDRLTKADLEGGTFTISNHGVSGSLVATPIVINQPQSAILGIGKLEKRVVVLESGGAEAIAIRPRCYVSLTIDHRVLDGRRANEFLQVFVGALEGWKD